MTTQKITTLLCTLTEGGTLTIREYGEQIRELVRALSVSLCATTSSDVAQNVCCVLHQLTGGNDAASVIEEVFRCNGLVAVLIKLTKNQTSSRHLPRKSYFALCVICNLTVAASNDHLDDLLARDFLSLLSNFSKHSSASDVAIKACGAVSNLCARSPQVLQMVMDAGLVDMMAGLASDSRNAQVRSRATSLIFALCKANPQQRTTLVEAGCLECLVSVLKIRTVGLDRVQLVCEALRCLKVLLTRRTAFDADFAADFSTLDMRMDTAGGWSQVECLQRSTQRDVRLLAKELEKTRGERRQVQPQA